MLNALRLSDGFELATFSERTGLAGQRPSPRRWLRPKPRGCIERDVTRAWPTARGFDFLSDLQALFLPGKLICRPTACALARASSASMRCERASSSRSQCRSASSGGQSRSDGG